jgi:hypothetical protein
MRFTRTLSPNSSATSISRKVLCVALLAAGIFLGPYRNRTFRLVSMKNPELETQLAPLTTPIMILDNTKGLTNQRSYALSGLHLARLLGWGVMIPSIVSPIDCNHDTECYQYSKFQPVNFSEIYDLDHFIRGAARLGIAVYQQLPDGYEALPDELWPCMAHRRCRDTFDGLVEKYSRITGRFTVAAPGIAASIIDSRRTAESVIEL